MKGDIMAFGEVLQSLGHREIAKWVPLTRKEKMSHK